MPALKSLSLSRNKLHTFSFEKCPEMLKFPKLQELDISYNLFDSEPKLDPLREIKSLNVLSITGNPMSLRNEMLIDNLEESLGKHITVTIINLAVEPPA